MFNFEAFRKQDQQRNLSVLQQRREDVRTMIHFVRQYEDHGDDYQRQHGRTILRYKWAVYRAFLHHLHTTSYAGLPS